MVALTTSTFPAFRTNNARIQLSAALPKGDIEQSADRRTPVDGNLLGSTSHPFRQRYNGKSSGAKKRELAQRRKCSSRRETGGPNTRRSKKIMSCEAPLHSEIRNREIAILQAVLHCSAISIDHHGVQAARYAVTLDLPVRAGAFAEGCC